MPEAPSPDRKPLSPAERQAVAMLGDDHTAKPIARELGISVNAVNQRLREARGTTGLGSSREVARWLKQKPYKKIGTNNRDGAAPRQRWTTALPGASFRYAAHDRRRFSP
ncbi:hypothetical protein EAH79_01640 [Sphingomonas koreensis]|nr:hypothetical protein EAH79_01640 [Sphingomonas koreensis]